MHALIVEEAVKVHSKSLCNFTCLGKTVSISLKFNGIFLFFLKEDALPQMRQISLEVTIDNLSRLSLSLFMVVSTRQRYEEKFCHKSNKKNIS